MEINGEEEPKVLSDLNAAAEEEQTQKTVEPESRDSPEATDQSASTDSAGIEQPSPPKEVTEIEQQQTPSKDSLEIEIEQQNSTIHDEIRPEEMPASPSPPKVWPTTSNSSDFGPKADDEEAQLMPEKNLPDGQGVISASRATFGEDQSVYYNSLNYDPEAGYDPCREWLRLIAGLTSVVVAIVTVYPIHLGVDCFLDNYQDGDVDLTQCKNLFNIEYSLSVLIFSILLEAAMIFLFVYACRHEFCGVKRKYTSGLLFCSKMRSRSSIVYPMAKADPPSTPKLTY